MCQIYTNVNIKIYIIYKKSIKKILNSDKMRELFDYFPFCVDKIKY